MTDDELQDLYCIGDEFPVCIKAWEHIQWLEGVLCDKEVLIADMKSLLKGDIE